MQMRKLFEKCPRLESIGVFYMAAGSYRYHCNGDLYNLQRKLYIVAFCMHVSVLMNFGMIRW